MGIFRSTKILHVQGLNPKHAVAKKEMFHGFKADYSPRFYFIWEGGIFTREKFGTPNKLVDMLCTRAHN